MSLSEPTSKAPSKAPSISPSEPDVSAPSIDEIPADEVANTDSGKLKQLLGILKKTIGVKDLASLRLSLPASFLEPRGNLEYWCYLDRADVFASLGSEEDELDRFMGVLRWSCEFLF